MSEQSLSDQSPRCLECGAALKAVLQCTDCSATLEAVTIYLHPDMKETLEWLMQYRNQEADQNLERLIWLEGSRTRPTCHQTQRW